MKITLVETALVESMLVKTTLFKIALLETPLLETLLLETPLLETPLLKTTLIETALEYKQNHFNLWFCPAYNLPILVHTFNITSADFWLMSAVVIWC